MSFDPQFITPANRSNYSSPPATTVLQDDNYLADYIDVLSEFNSRKILYYSNLDGTLPYLSINSPAVELLFNVCSLFEMPVDVKYIALDIFDRFLTKHFVELRDVARSSSADLITQKQNWSRFSARARKQALLRAVSSILLASKFALQSTALSVKHIHTFLRGCGHAYSLKSVSRSEKRVFSSLDCMVPLYSVYDFLTALLEGLKSYLDIEILLPTCEKMLSYVFLQRGEIYVRYFWIGTGRWEPNREERIQFATVELNDFLMVSAVIVSCVYIHRVEELGPNKVSGILSDLTKVNGDDIRGLAVIITQTLLGSRAVSFSYCN